MITRFCFEIPVADWLFAAGNWIKMSPGNGVRDRLFRVLTFEMSFDNGPSCSSNKANGTVVPPDTGVCELNVSLKTRWPVVSLRAFCTDPGSI